MRSIQIFIKGYYKQKFTLNSFSFFTGHVDIAALQMVDEAYLDRTEWIKKSIRTSAKVCSI